MSDRRRVGLASAAAACVSLAAWCSLGTLTLSSAGGAAERIGVLPPVWVLAACLGAALAAVWLVRPSRDTVVPWFASAALILPWLPLPWPAAVLALSGPVTLPAWSAILAASLVAAGWSGGPPSRRAWISGRQAPVVAGSLALVVYATASWQTAPVLPGGDEPHYLIITQSLVNDGDLRIENNHTRGDYQSYFRGVLRPDFLRRGRDGQIYSIHLPGVSVLIAPAFAVGGYPAVRLWLALLSALAAGITWRLAWRTTASAAAAWFATAGVALTVPFVFLAFTVYPDGPGAVLVMAAFAMLAASEDGTPRGRRWWAAAGALAAALPWLHPRFAVLAASLGVLFAGRALREGAGWRRALAAYALLPVASALAWFGYYVSIYGSPDPAIAYGHYTQMAAGNAVRGLPGLLFDQQFGLIAAAPVFALALTGLVPLLKHHRRLAVSWLVVTVPYAVATALYYMWWGGQSSPARFLGPVMLLAAVPIAAAWLHAAGVVSRTWQAMALAVSLALTACFISVDHGRFAFSFRDGYAAWAVWASTLGDVAGALPSWFRIGPGDGAVTAAAWVVAVAAGWAVSRWLTTARSLARGVSSLLAAGCLWAAASAAATAAWRTGGASGLAPTTGQLAVLRALASDRVPLTVSYDPLRVGAGRSLASGMRLGGERAAGAPADAWLWLPNLPAGQYQLWVDNRRSGADLELSVTVGRSADPIRVWSLHDARPGPQSLDLRLPVDVHSLTVRGPSEDRAAVRGLWLQPVAITDPRARVAAERAAAAGRYGAGTIIWALGEDSYLEKTGVWIAGETTARLVMDGSGDEARRVMELRAGPVPVAVEVVSGPFTEKVVLAAGESRTVNVPDTQRGPVLLEIRTDTGFRPSQTDPGSSDDRLLGVWLSFPSP